MSLFTVGTLVNRRRGSRHDIEARLPLVDDSDSSDTSSPPLKAIYLDHPRRYTRRNAPNLFFDLLSRFWNKYPFLPEIWYWNLTYWYV